MAITHQQMLAIQLERLRAILLQLEAVRSGARHDELLDRARVVVADVRKTRALLAGRGRPAKRTSKTSMRGCVLDYVRVP